MTTLAVGTHGNHYVGDRSISVRVSPHASVFGRERWRAQILVDGDSTRWQGEVGKAWPSFTGRHPDRALAKAEEWAAEAREKSTAEDARLAGAAARSTVIEIPPKP